MGYVAVEDIVLESTAEAAAVAAAYTGCLVLAAPFSFYCNHVDIGLPGALKLGALLLR